MDVVTTTSLEALLERASSNFFTNPDMGAIEAFWNVIRKEREGPCIGVRLLAQRIASPVEKEALQALNVLDACMKHCGPIFHAEVGKFRFLNELIKIVSPKYLGTRSSPLVRNKILHLMHKWIKEYPRETKIKEAFDMLRKQGVIHEDAYGNITPILCGFASQPVKTPPQSPKPAASGQRADDGRARNSVNNIFEDEEKSKLLQKLLRSKNPDDLQAANRLIKTMVREDEKRVELISRRSTELQTVHNNARLLSEMLDSYRPDQVSAGELELIKELHQSCERLRPAVFRLASETQQSEELLNEVLEASVALGEVFEKYKSVIIHGNIIATSDNSACATNSNNNAAGGASIKVDSGGGAAGVASLLDLSTPVETASMISPAATTTSTTSPPPQSQNSDIDALSDIFNSVVDVNNGATNNCLSSSSQNLNILANSNSVLQPVNISQAKTNEVKMANEEKVNNKSKGLEDLDVLGETLLKENLTGATRLGNFKKSAVKVPLNMLAKTPPTSPVNQPQDRGDIGAENTNLDLDYLINGAKLQTPSPAATNILNGDNSLISTDLITPLTASITAESPPLCPLEDKPEEDGDKIEVEVVEKTASGLNDNVSERTTPVKVATNSNSGSATVTKEIKPLTDLFVTLDNIKPSSIPPLTVLEKNEITVILHFAKDSPRDDVAVIVVSTISKSASPLTEYVFQAVVPKTCKLKLQPPSGSSLPAHNPFLPPAAITQVLLIANPNRAPVSLKFMISYTMDEEMITEMGEVEELPLYKENSSDIAAATES